jgi:hypothetical protein
MRANPSPAASSPRRKKLSTDADARERARRWLAALLSRGERAQSKPDKSGAK